MWQEDETNTFTQKLRHVPKSLSFCRQRLLVFGGGAVGFAAIQLGVAFGCHVTASCVGQTKDRILAAGAEQAVDYLTEVGTQVVYLLIQSRAMVILF